MLVKYSSNYCRCGAFLVLRDDILNDIQETIWSVPLLVQVQMDQMKNLMISSCREKNTFRNFKLKDSKRRESLADKRNATAVWLWRKITAESGLALK